MHTTLQNHKHIVSGLASLLFIASFVFAPFAYAGIIRAPRPLGSGDSETGSASTLFARLASVQGGNNGGTTSGNGGSGGAGGDGGVVRSGNVTSVSNSVNVQNRTVIIIGR